MKKILIILLCIPLVLILAAVLVLGYFGFIPGLSSIMGSNKPKDLGVRYSAQDFNNYKTKDKYQHIETNSTAPGKSLEYSGQIEVADIFSQEEITSRINYSRWKYIPLTNFQIRFPSEDTIEFSGNLMLDRFPGFIEEVEEGKYSKEEIQKFMKYLDFTLTNPPIYAEAKVSITNNKADIDIEKLQLGRFNVDVNKNSFSENLEDAVEKIFSQVPGFYAKSVKFTPAGMYFEGTKPEKATVLVE